MARARGPRAARAPLIEQSCSQQIERLPGTIRRLPISVRPERRAGPGVEGRPRGPSIHPPHSQSSPRSSSHSSSRSQSRSRSRVALARGRSSHPAFTVAVLLALAVAVAFPLALAGRQLRLEPGLRSCEAYARGRGRPVPALRRRKLNIARRGSRAVRPHQRRRARARDTVPRRRAVPAVSPTEDL
jgi:hypothetical protein